MELMEGKIGGQDSESIYDGKLNFDEIIKNPILKPISEINKSYENLELSINRALYEFQEKYTKIKNLLDENPKYGETMFVTIIFSMIEYIKQIVHSQDLQKQNMKDAINEMIDIVGEKYMQTNEDEENEDIEVKPQQEILRPLKEKQPQPINIPKDIPINIPLKENKEDILTMNKLSEIAGDTENQPQNNLPREDTTKEAKGNEKVYYSDLVDKKIAVPD